MYDQQHLKTIMHSKRAHIFYLEKCKVLLNAGRVEYLTQEKNIQAYYNIPIANTTFILLGIGTSITQAAIRKLSAAGVIVGFCGNNGTPLLSAPEIDWYMPVSEYRPTEYMQRWYSIWIDESKRLEVAKDIQLKRIDYLCHNWSQINSITKSGFHAHEIMGFLDQERKSIARCKNNQELLLVEAKKIKQLYQYCSRKSRDEDFKRDSKAKDPTNKFLTHGNYLAYGVAATVLWVLGISHSFAILHGKTRRGGLVFDVADIIKDSYVLPTAFIASTSGYSDQEFRDMMAQVFIDNKVYDFLFDYIKDLCLNHGA